jgi:ubiquinone/menaquinone biosynthesis C-methylase UbiE
MKQIGLASSFINTLPPKSNCAGKMFLRSVVEMAERLLTSRTFRPERYTGLDLNGAGIRFCQQRHQIEGLIFVQGDAENLPFEPNTLDAVVNVEASHCYPDFPRFLAEVARVLKAGGHFLYADFRFSDVPPKVWSGVKPENDAVLGRTNQ